MLALVLRNGDTANVAFVDVVTFLAEGSGQSATRYRIEMFDGDTLESGQFVASAHIEGEGLGRTRMLPLEVHGEVWTIRFTDRRPTDVSSTSIALLVGGLVGTALLFALVFVVSRSELRARRMVREATEELSRQEQHFRALVANSSDLVTVIDAQGKLCYVSPAVTRLLAYEEEDLLGVDVMSLVHPDDVEAVSTALDTMFTAPRSDLPPLVLRVRHAHGGWRHLESTGSNLLDNPAMQGIVVNSRDVTERVAFQEHLETQATHDALTGLPNRTLLLDRLSDALERATDANQTAVLFVDLDRFKLVNDSLGHGAGDRLLVLVAERLRHAVRPGDIVARFGGDEFVVLAERVADADECSQIADRLAEKLAAPFRIEGQEVFVTASVGMTLADPATDTADTLLRDADAAMYRAKDGGRARSVLFEEQVHQRTVERLEQEAALHRALERDELIVLYQPQLDLASGEIVGVETFLGWQHPDRGLLGPGEFLRVAEDTGLIVPFGAFALEHACADAARWMERFGRPLRVSVNVSARQLVDAELYSLVSDTLSQSGLPADALCLEVSESVLTDTRDVAAALHAVRDLGVRVAIDDFGTGYAALAHLKRFPVDQLKIDSTFVSGLGTNPDDTVIVAAVIGLAHALGVVAVAEGVENDTQLDELRALRCDVAQGYLFAHPGDATAIDLLLGTPV
jgi:diguanylate cyclase (GGDEF)-like protein/PAS domain S-box-containing protein